MKLIFYSVAHSPGSMQEIMYQNTAKPRKHGCIIHNGNISHYELIYIYEFRANHYLKAVFYCKSDIIKTHFSTPKSQITSDKKHLKDLNIDQEFIID